jgi:arylsulfatase
MYKHYCHEGGIRTPLVVHWPNGFAAKGEFRDQVGHVIDVMATFVDVSGAKYPTQSGPTAITPMEGKSLTPSFAGRPTERDYLAWEHEGNRAIRSSKWKLVAKAKAEWELYDLDADPVELNDLAASQPDRAKTLAAQWDAWAERCNVPSYPPRRP